MSSVKNAASKEIEFEHIDKTEEAIEQIVQSYGVETRGRKPTGRNTNSKAYHKITISMTLEEKRKIKSLAEEQNIGVSQLIRGVLANANVI